MNSAVKKVGSLYRGSPQFLGQCPRPFPDNRMTQKLMEASGFPGFRNLVNSELFDIRKEDHREVNQDMTRSLDKYICRSSHNTFLTGNQLWGLSSLEGLFIRAKDCACIELDLHDGPDGKAIITHGGTLTSKILARDVIEHAILPYIFKNNDYPVILSWKIILVTGKENRFSPIWKPL